MSFLVWLAALFQAVQTGEPSIDPIDPWAGSGEPSPTQPTAPTIIVTPVDDIDIPIDRDIQPPPAPPLAPLPDEPTPPELFPNTPFRFVE